MQHPRQQQIVQINQQEYGARAGQIRWITPEAAVSAMETRGGLLQALSRDAHFGYRDTKLDCRDLSPGCRACGEGVWSCLFINGKCPCGCFFCPTEQTRIDQPMTNTVTFRRPAAYVAYIERFGFRGVSISGGEPFLTMGTSLAFVSAVKKRFGDGVHIWLYTSGRLVNPEDLKRFRDAGVAEMRFNIAATGYRLDAARQAVGIIPWVTVETPAVPEETGRMKQLMGEMAESGITHLNLHQLRLTPYNFDRLTRRGYTFLHGEKVTVMESELAALALMRHGIDEQIPLPVNYCSFVYKHRFQMAAFRRRNAKWVQKPYEDVTETGHIRTFWAVGEPAHLAAAAAELERREPAGGRWHLTPSRDTLYIAEPLWEAVDPAGLHFHISYHDARIEESVSYRHPFVKQPLTREQQVFIERRRMAPAMAVDAAVPGMIRAGGCPADAAPALKAVWEAIRPFEIIPSGLQDYF